MLDHLVDRGANTVGIMAAGAGQSYEVDSIDAYRAWSAERGSPESIDGEPPIGVASTNSPIRLRSAVADRLDRGDLPDAIYCVEEIVASLVAHSIARHAASGSPTISWWLDQRSRAWPKRPHRRSRPWNCTPGTWAPPPPPASRICSMDCRSDRAGDDPDHGGGPRVDDPWLPRSAPAVRTHPTARRTRTSPLTAVAWTSRVAPFAGSVPPSRSEAASPVATSGPTRPPSPGFDADRDVTETGLQVQGACAGGVDPDIA